MPGSSPYMDNLSLHPPVYYFCHVIILTDTVAAWDQSKNYRGVGLKTNMTLYNNYDTKQYFMHQS